MQERLRQLVALQRVDEELVAANAEAAGLPARRAAAEAERAAAEQQLAQARGEHQTRELALRAAQRAVAEAEDRIRDRQGKMSMVKTNEEYRALDSEITALKVSIQTGDLADRALEAMYAAEAAEEALETAEENARSVGARAADTLARLDARAAELETARAALAAARAEAARKVDPDLLHRYERVVERRRPGIALVKGEICSGCSLGIPPQSLVNLIHGIEVVTCVSCRRILIHASLLEGS